MGIVDTDEGFELCGDEVIRRIGDFPGLQVLVFMMVGHRIDLCPHQVASSMTSDLSRACTIA